MRVPSPVAARRKYQMLHVSVRRPLCLQERPAGDRGAAGAALYVLDPYSIGSNAAIGVNGGVLSAGADPRNSATAVACVSRYVSRS
jgi:hypothetical protein